MTCRFDRLLAAAYKTGDFILASGEKSREYIDVKSMILSPRVGQRIVVELASLISSTVGIRQGILLAGVPEAGSLLAWGTMAAIKDRYQLDTPCLLVRRESKEHGLRRLIEGLDNIPLARRNKKWPVVILEDVITTGGSIIETTRTIARSDCLVPKCVFAVVDREQGGMDNIVKETGIPVRTLTTISRIRAAKLAAPPEKAHATQC